MKPSYDPAQQGFDFGAGNLLQDVCCIFDMSEFPNIEPLDVAVQLRCRGEYAIEVYRKCMEIWEKTLDQEIVDELRQLSNRDCMSIEMMAIVLGESEDSVQSDLQDAINHVGFALDQLETDIAA